MPAKGTHWTERSIEDFVHNISSDFVIQLEKKMDTAHISAGELAQALGLSAGRVSQVLNDPGNLTLKNCVRFARGLGMKTALVAYEDGDQPNDRGPINSEIFYRCWQRYGSPTDFFELAERSQTPTVVIQPQSGSTTYVMVFEWPSDRTNIPLSVANIDTGLFGREKRSSQPAITP
jgi:hypothetical protein